MLKRAKSFEGQGQCHSMQGQSETFYFLFIVHHLEFDKTSDCALRIVNKTVHKLSKVFGVVGYKRWEFLK